MENRSLENAKAQLGIVQRAQIGTDTTTGQLISVSLDRETKTISIKLNNSNGTWKLLTKKSRGGFKDPLSIVAITHSEDKIFILDLENNLEYFDLIEKEWIHLSSALTSNEYPALAYYKGQVYVMGWTTFKALNISTKTMRNISQMKYPRVAAGIEVVGDRIYVVGGQLRGEGSLSNKVEVYEPDTDTWTECPSLNVPRTFNNVVFFNGYLYAIGGFLCVDVERYKPGDDNWESIESLPLAFNFPPACVYKRSIIVLYQTVERKWFKYNESENNWKVIDISYRDNDEILQLFCVDGNYNKN